MPFLMTSSVNASLAITTTSWIRPDDKMHHHTRSDRGQPEDYSIPDPNQFSGARSGDNGSPAQILPNNSVCVAPHTDANSLGFGRYSPHIPPADYQRRRIGFFEISAIVSAALVAFMVWMATAIIVLAALMAVFALVPSFGGSPAWFQSIYSTAP